MFFHFTRTSTNTKIGPMPAVMAAKESCPSTCALKGAGCYAELGPLGLHWSRVSAGTAKNLLDLEQLCRMIRTLPRKIRWRYGTAGDLPPAHEDVLKLADANAGREAIVFTHGRRYGTYRLAAERGMHINVSTDDTAQADKVLDEAPDMSVVTVLPSDTTRGKHFTPAGREIAICPAVFNRNTTCSTCNLCFRPRPRGVIIGFPAHGNRRRMVDRRLAAA